MQCYDHIYAYQINLCLGEHAQARYTAVCCVLVCVCATEALFCRSPKKTYIEAYIENLILHFIDP